ncbi:hypothetical protein V1Y59_16035 [Gordonia sp. PKS22-38]|uniref:Uncharacterized protein n=1 Tax=Gordonia prachuapensis TaxID=3115651 RepID=A0ABU7MWT0_9ACTN|nr:hypothetical protein [Gordonia sp. PKS22-38]
MTTDDTPIPDITTAHDPIRGTEDLRQRWRALMGELGFSAGRIWFAFVGTDRRLVKILDWLPLPPEPDAHLVDMLTGGLTSAVDQLPVTSVAFLISRPGRDGVTDVDQAWATVLIESARRNGLPIQPIHRANDVHLVTLTTALDAAA